MKNIMEIIASMEAKLEESKNNNTNIINNFNVVIAKTKTAEEAIIKAKATAKANAKAKYNEEIAKIEAEAKEQMASVRAEAKEAERLRKEKEKEIEASEEELEMMIKEDTSLLKSLMTQLEFVQAGIAAIKNKYTLETSKVEAPAETAPTVTEVSSTVEEAPAESVTATEEAPAESVPATEEAPEETVSAIEEAPAESETLIVYSTEWHKPEKAIPHEIYGYLTHSKYGTPMFYTKNKNFNMEKDFFIFDNYGGDTLVTAEDLPDGKVKIKLLTNKEGKVSYKTFTEGNRKGGRRFTVIDIVSIKE